MVASAERDEDARTSLALLQNHIKRDPEAYQQEFTTQPHQPPPPRTDKRA